MKKSMLLAVTCLFFLFFSSCDKINLPWKHHKDEDHQLNNIVCTGTGIVAGPGLSDTDKYPAQLLKNLQQDGYEPVNVTMATEAYVNIQSETMTIGDHMDPFKVENAVNIIVVTEIVKDTRDNRTPPDYSASLLRAYCDSARAHGWKVIVSTAPYANPFYQRFPTPPFPDPSSIVSDSGYDSLGFVTQISQINELVRSEYTSYADGLLDLGSDARLAAYSSTYFMPNHLDLTAEGAAVVAQLAEIALNPLLAK